MNDALKYMVELLDVDQIEPQVFKGENQPVPHVFGGQVLGQAVMAASKNVENRELHSLHSYFLLAGDWEQPIRYEVENVREGRSFSTRRVVAKQNERAIFILSASFQVQESGLEHQHPELPDVPPPEDLPSDAEMFKKMAEGRPEMQRFKDRYNAIESRHVEPFNFFDRTARAPIKHAWMKTASSLPDNLALHQSLLAYMSDMGFMSTSLLPHAVSPREGVQAASLDHAMWFHDDFRVDDWLLFAQESPIARGARGFVRGHFYTRDGRLVASATQECLIRPVESKDT
ncbi:MAG: acyl-CoA thioesterase II [Pseudomonadota bacterium]